MSEEKDYVGINLKFVAFLCEKRHVCVWSDGMPRLVNNWLTRMIQTFKIKINKVCHLWWLDSQFLLFCQCRRMYIYNDIGEAAVHSNKPYQQIKWTA